MTPEGKVKAAVKKILATYGEELSAVWPVQNGMGSPTLDCLVCYRGHYIAIETKAPGKIPTPRQLITISKMETAGAKVFVIDGDMGYRNLDLYLCGLQTWSLISYATEPQHNQIHSRF